MINLHPDCDDKEKWFEAEVQIYPGQPDGFESWSKDVTQCNYSIYLPDGTRTTAKLFMDLQQRFDNFEFTRYLINRYLDLNE